MKQLAALFVVIGSAWASYAQTATTPVLSDSGFTVSTYTTAASAAGHSLQATQQDRAAFLPMRMAPYYPPFYGSAMYERVTNLVLWQPTLSETSQINIFSPNAHEGLPPQIQKTGSCVTPPLNCTTLTLGTYEAHEFSTYALARTYYNSLNAFVKPHAYGPFATPRQTYLVAHPALLVAFYTD